MRAQLTSVNATSDSVTGMTRMAIVFAALGAGSMLLAIIVRRPDLVALAVPFLVAVGLAFLGNRDDVLAVQMEFDDDYWLEGDVSELRVIIESSAGIRRCEVEVDLPPGIAAPVAPLRAIVAVHPGTPRVVSFPLELKEWGIFTPRQLRIRATDELGLLARDHRFAVETDVRVRLHEERLRTVLAPDRYRRVVGSHPSNDRGDGTELADVREYRTGDPMKWINWRISNRRREPWVTVRHPDRSATIVILVDGYVTGGAKERAIARMAEALTKAHLDIHDRVGLLVVGHHPTWIEPQLGKRQLHRIAETLLDLTGPDTVDDAIDPTRVVPGDAVVVGISTLDDRRIVGALAALRSRGRTISVIEPTFPNALLTSRVSTQHTEPFARRLYALEREVSRRDLRAHGLVVVPWPDDAPIETPIATLARRQRGQQP